MKEYKTEQRNILLSFFEQNKNNKYNIEQIINLIPSDSKISRSAIYRNINKMVQDGVLCKSLSPKTRKTTYQYFDCSESCCKIHLKCEKCGKIIHLENNDDEFKLNSILLKNGFEPNNKSTVIYAVCKDCKEKNNDPKK